MKAVAKFSNQRWAMLRVAVLRRTQASDASLSRIGSSLAVCVPPNLDLILHIDDYQVSQLHLHSGRAII